MVVSLVSDSTGRPPMFHLANGSVHVGLTDSSGVVSMLEPTWARHRIEQTRSGVPRLVKRIEPKLRQARIDGRSEEEYNDLMMLFDHSGGAWRDELLY
jgi:hypothetical protein